MIGTLRQKRVMMVSKYQTKAKCNNCGGTEFKRSNLNILNYYCRGCNTRYIGEKSGRWLKVRTPRGKDEDKNIW